MNIYLYVSTGIIAAAGIWQLGVWLFESKGKRQKYRDAVSYAKRAGKPLLVAGGPWGVLPYRYRLRVPAHGSGDVCLDIDWHALRDYPCGIISDVKWIPFQDKCFGAVFASHILEHLNTVEDAAMAIGELKRVSDAVFIVSPSRQSIAASLKKEHHLWLWQKGNVICIKQRGREGKYRAVVRCPLPLLK